MKKEKIITFALFIFLFFINCNSSENIKPELIYESYQSKQKAIILGDLEIFNGPSFFGLPDASSPNWKPVKIPFVNKMQTPFFMNYKTIWLRGKFKIKEYGWDMHYVYYGIRLGLIAAANLVYINNELIGTFESREFDKYLWPSSYVLPAHVNLKETNEVYIRFITDRENITLISDIIIQDKTSYLQSEKWNNFLYNQLPVGFSILLIGMLIILLKNYFIFKNKRHLLYALYLFNMFLFPLIIYSPTNFLKFEMSLAILFVTVPINILLTILIFQSLYGIYLTKQNIISGSILLLISIYFITRSYNPYDYETIIQPMKFIYIPLLIYYIYLIYLLNSHRPDKFKLKVIISLFVTIIIISNIQGLGEKYNIWYQYFYYIYSTPIYAALIIIYETREAKKRRAELEILHSRLEKNNNGSNQLLTESAEKKIEKVIDFLNENFTSDISREGLASAVDMNPNYMSKLFYKHTGKKINEYINGLRIADAARQLAESNNGKKVIDIALGVGFDSLSTFNRAFKNIYRVTPTEYKKKNNSNSES